jgi:ketosteroid isomerase-like protein
MSERTNTEVVQQGYEAFGRGDIPALLEFVADDVEWIQQGPSAIPFTGTRHGHEGVAEYFSLLDVNLDFEQFEPREFVAQDDTVVVLGFERSVMKSTGRPLENEWAHVYTLRDGKIAKARLFEDTGAYAAALESS